MSELIDAESDASRLRRPERGALFVRDIRHSNSAAKFWPGLVDEVGAEFPATTRIALTATTSGPLTRNQLFPEKLFEYEVDRLLAGDLEQMWKDVVAEMEILGPPSAVGIRLILDGEELVARELPLDCVDADIFPCLAVWLLEWAGIHPARWNDEVVEGAFLGEDRVRQLAYRFSFRVDSKHLSEGLYERSVTVAAEVSTIDADATARRPRS